MAALPCLVDVYDVCPTGSLLDESAATVSATVKGAVSNDPSAIIAAIIGTGVDVMFSLQICQAAEVL
jgi:hypothetical protein